jgi:hypothetical protein
MRWASAAEWGFRLVVFVPFGLAAVGVFVAVFAKALRKCPYQPNEDRVFNRPTLPRAYSALYAVRLRRPARAGISKRSRGGRG